MKSVCIALPIALLGAFPAHSGGVPLAWTVDAARGASCRAFDQWAGAEYELEATVMSAGRPLEIDGDVALYYQTNGMGRLYWKQPAAASNNVIRAAWLPSYEAGAGVYSGFLGAPGKVWNAAFKLRLRPSPGASPNALALPAPRIDFAAVEVANAPWATEEGVDAKVVAATDGLLRAVDGLAAEVAGKADAAAVYAKDEADARFYPADEGALWASWWSGDGFRVAVSNYDVAASSAAWDRLPQTKKKALMQQQLGSFFRTELTKAFGSEPEPATLPIDRAYLKAAKLSAVDFTECTVTDFHEGEHKGLRFSAANVELRRTVEEKSGPDNDNWMTRTETLFRGIVVRCEDICDPTLDIALNDMFQERKKDDITDPAAFRKHFAAHTADGREADDQVTPQLRDLVQKLEASSASAKLCGLVLRGGDLTLALNTRYVFADVPEELDLRDIDGIRKWFTASLTGMGNLLDLITESPALTGGME